MEYVLDEEAIKSGHQMIDQTFGTNYTPHYAEEFKEEIAYLNERLGLDVSVAALPPVTTGAGAVATTGSTIASVVAVKATTMVYRSLNIESGEVNYVGITNNFIRRAREHAKQKNIIIRRIDNMPLLSREDARAVEQTLINLHQLGKDGGTLINNNSLLVFCPFFF